MSVDVLADFYDMLATSLPNFRHSSLIRKLRKLYCSGGVRPRSSACYLETA
jgi:hypothetical protein